MTAFPRRPASGQERVGVTKRHLAQLHREPRLDLRPKITYATAQFLFMLPGDPFFEQPVQLHHQTPVSLLKGAADWNVLVPVGEYVCEHAEPDQPADGLGDCLLHGVDQEPDHSHVAPRLLSPTALPATGYFS
jgi:hypothetical protein